MKKIQQVIKQGQLRRERKERPLRAERAGAGALTAKGAAGGAGSARPGCWGWVLGLGCGQVAGRRAESVRAADLRPRQ